MFRLFRSRFRLTIAAALSVALVAPSPLPVAAQDSPDGTAATADAPPVAIPKKRYKLEDLPRDANGYLLPAVWDIMEEQAKAAPRSNEARVFAERHVYQQYYKQYAGWTAPAPLPVTAGRLRNLPDIPTQPRFAITDPVWPEKAGQAAVCMWEDDKLAAISVGVDDNNAMDLPYWRLLSKKYNGIKITWYLITHNIGGVVSKGRVVGAGKWETWQAMLDEGYHLGSHSVTHNHCPVPADGWPGPDFEAAESARSLDANLKGQRTLVFAYPGSGVQVFAPHRVKGQNYMRPSVAKYYIAARGGGGKAINRANMIDYMSVASTTGAVPLLLDPNNKTAPDQNLHNLFAADPKHTYHDFYRGWADVFIHFINNGKDFEKNPFNVAFEKIFAFIDANRDKLWHAYFDEIARYAAERDAATLTVDEATDAVIKLTLVTKMEPALFDYPLSVKVRLPATWKGFSAKQNGNLVTGVELQHEGGSFAMLKIVPDRGQVTLTPAGK